MVMTSSLLVCVLGDNSTESSSLHDDISICLPADPGYLCPNVLSFPVTIRPYHEGLGIPCFICKVSGNSLGAFFDRRDNGRVEKRERVTGFP